MHLPLFLSVHVLGAVSLAFDSALGTTRSGTSVRGVETQVRTTIPPPTKTLDNLEKAPHTSDDFCFEDTPKGLNTSTDARPHVGNVTYDQVITSCTKPGVIALTYSDGPFDYTGGLLDRLAQHGFKATFFVSATGNGREEIDAIPRRAALIKRMFAEGHQVASSTWSSTQMNGLATWQRRKQLINNERVIANIIGMYPTYFRSHGGDCTEDSGCVADLAALGYHTINGDLLTEDWKFDIQKAKNIAQNFISKQPINGNVLAVQHDTIRESAADLTDFIIEQAINRRWKGVTVGECLGDDQENWYRLPKWVAPATIPEDACIMAEGGFCGTIKPFTNRTDCFTSNSDCYRQVQDCPEEMTGVVSHYADACLKFQKINGHNTGQQNIWRLHNR